MAILHALLFFAFKTIFWDKKRSIRVPESDYQREINKGFPIANFLVYQ